MIDIQGILAALESHALASGRFEQVNTHEPKSSPGNGLTSAIWVQQIRPVPASSGLAATSGAITFTQRLYTNMLQEPQDAIDPEMVGAVDVMLRAYSGDFTLKDAGGNRLIRNIDLLGAAGTPLSAIAGYVTIDRTLHRVMDITIPCIVNDLWEQAP